MNLTENGATAIGIIGAPRLAIAMTDRSALGIADGAWDSATCYVQYKTATGTWVDYPAAAFTANFCKYFDAISDEFRVVLDGGGASLDLDLDYRAVG